MGNPYFPAELAPATISEFLAAAGFAVKQQTGRAMSDAGLRVVCAHWMLETGTGKHMYCYNSGNIKAGSGWTGGITYYQGNEIFGGKVYWMDYGPTTVPGKGIINRFRAYRTFQDGVNDYIALKRGGRYARAWQFAQAGDIEGYGRALGEAGYYTAGSDYYMKGLRNCHNSVRGAKVPPPAAMPLRPLEPAGCDPMQGPDPPKPGFRPYPPRGPKQGFGHGTCCNGVYAKHMGYKEGQSPVAEPIIEGYECPEAPKKKGKTDPTPPTPPGPPTPDPPTPPGPPGPPGPPPDPPPPRPPGPPPTPTSDQVIERVVSAVSTGSKEAPIDIRLPKQTEQALAFTAVDGDGKALAGWHWLVEASDGSRREGKLDGSGYVTVDLPKGRCTIKITRQALPPAPPPAPPPDWSAEVGEGAASRRRSQPIEDILNRLKQYKK